MKTNVTWNIGIHQVDYLWGKSQANVYEVYENWVHLTFLRFILPLRYCLKRFEKMSWKGHGKVIEFHSWISV